MLSFTEISTKFIGLPWQYLALSLSICLVLSALGFKHVVYFVSLGYATSIAAQAIVMPFIYWNTLHGWVLVQATLLLAYGLRLGTFVTIREQAASYHNEQAENAAREAKVRDPMKAAIWIIVSILYVLMFLPVLLTMSAQAAEEPLRLTPVGVVLMAIGLVAEACADWQKSQFKKHNPSHFCDVGLYRVVRFPNYFGEILFWFGVWISAISAYQSLLAWLLGSLGFVCIAGIMIDSSRRLELEQTSRYGADPAYLAYARMTPILFPFLPLYSLRNAKVRVG